MKNENEGVVAVAVAVDDVQHAEVLVNGNCAIASRQRESSQVDEEGIRAFLDGENWPLGLIQTYLENANKVGFRYFIVDDSGSMNNPDGRLPYSNSRIPVTRWDELRGAMKWHVDAVCASNLPSEFRFLNGAEAIRLGGDYDRAPRRSRIMASIIFTLSQMSQTVSTVSFCQGQGGTMIAILLCALSFIHKREAERVRRFQTRTAQFGLASHSESAPPPRLEQALA